MGGKGRGNEGSLSAAPYSHRVPPDMEMRTRDGWRDIGLRESLRLRGRKRKAPCKVDLPGEGSQAEAHSQGSLDREGYLGRREIEGQP